MDAEPDGRVYMLSDTERELIREGLDERDRGKIASDAEVRAVFDKYRASIPTADDPTRPHHEG